MDDLNTDLSYTSWLGVDTEGTHLSLKAKEEIVSTEHLNCAGSFT